MTINNKLHRASEINEVKTATKQGFCWQTDDDFFVISPVSLGIDAFSYGGKIRKTLDVPDRISELIK